MTIDQGDDVSPEMGSEGRAGQEIDLLKPNSHDNSKMGQNLDSNVKGDQQENALGDSERPE